MTSKRTSALLLAAALLFGAAVVPITSASANGKVTICHAAGKAGTTKYIELTLSESAIYKDQGGHFYENGTPRAGHEDDYIGECEGPHETTTTVAETTTTEEETTTTEPGVTTVPEVPTTIPDLDPPVVIERGPTPVVAEPGFTG